MPKPQTVSGSIKSMNIKWAYSPSILTDLLQISMSAEAQQKAAKLYSFEFRGEPLEHVLDRIAGETEMDLLRGVEVFERINNETVDGVLKAALADHGFDYLIFSSGTIVVIKMRSEGPAFGVFSGTVLDRRTGEPAD